MDTTRRMLTAVARPNFDGTAAPINQFARMPHYVSPDFKNVVRISLNSLWTTGFLDLDREPIVLSVPDTSGRYYVFSVMDMWTNVFASIGKRTTGTGPGAFLLAGPKWQGIPPSDIRQIFRCPTRYAWALGQTQCDGEDQFATVNALQAQYHLTPLAAWGRPYTPPTDVPFDRSIDPTVTPVDQVARMDAGSFFGRLGPLTRDNPPYGEDWPILDAMARAGIKPGQPFDLRAADPAIARGLQRAVDKVNDELWPEVLKFPNVNGWISPADIGRYGRDYSTRMGIAFVGLGADVKDDTIYPTTFYDAQGKLLSGDGRYVLRFERGQSPPTNGTWSVSQYVGNFYVRNALNRYAIRPSMPITYGADGALEIYFQAHPPGGKKDANWLPVPPHETFNVTIRNYWPKPEALNGSYKVPAIRRIG
jgi:hypothetical protein